MKHRVLAMVLTLALCLGLATLPAAALTFEDAEVYLSKVKSAKGGSYLVDFDNDGREELVIVELVHGDTHRAEVWQGSTKLGTVEAPGGLMGYTNIYLAAKGKKIYMTAFYGMIRGDWQEFQGLYTVENGKWIEKSMTAKTLKGYDWTTKLDNSSKNASVRSRLEAEVAALTAAMPQPPTVPATPLGSGLTPAKAGAVAALKDIAYSGDRDAITMTEDQAYALIGKIAEYTAAPNANYPSPIQTGVFATLFDAGAGVPGLFMAKGYQVSPYGMAKVSKNSASYDVGEAAVWTFQNGMLTPLALEASDGLTLYPACVMVNRWGEDGLNQDWVHAINYGSASNNPANVLVALEDYYNGNPTTYSVDGVPVSQSKYDAFQKAWKGTGARASAGRGGGVEYLMEGMTPAQEVTNALYDFVSALYANYAYPSTQSVDVDGRDVEFQCYALKDAGGNDTNYIKLRDLASVLRGTGARFEVSWDGAVNIEAGKVYTPNGSEMSTPFSGQRAYTPATAQTKINATPTDLDAIVLTDDTGGAYTYYKLRDLGNALGFSVNWTAERGIYIETE